VSVSAEIRKAALGPAPSSGGRWVYEWLGFYTDAHLTVTQGKTRLLNWHSPGVTEFTSKRSSETERRMFLLFAAESLESSESAPTGERA
jgi:hypothetical protein